MPGMVRRRGGVRVDASLPNPLPLDTTDLAAYGKTVAEERKHVSSVSLRLARSLEDNTRFRNGSSVTDYVYA